MESLFNAARRWMWPTETVSPPIVCNVSFKFPMQIEFLIPEGVDLNEILNNGCLDFCSEDFPEFHFPPHGHPISIDFTPNMDF